MANPTQSICTRCGKPRVVISTHKEQVGGSYVTFTETACPDPDCQKYVDKVNDKDREKREEIKKNSLERRSQWGASRKKQV
jgi:hypothetical protein